MNSTKSFHEISYLLHKNHNALENGELSEQQKTWLRNDTVDYWRHERMYKPLLPLLKSNPGSKWITIGDGRLGLDSIKLKKLEPSLDILPTDISVELLEYAKDLNLINGFEKQNAEKLSFEDNYFDFSFCKESYHHFPRPYIALYEMLRVADRAVILIEPNDSFSIPWPGQLLMKIKRTVKKILGKRIYHSDHWSFEEAGNYIYTLSKRETEKLALGLNLPAIACYYYNDYYEAGVEFEKADENSKLFKKVKHKISSMNRNCKLGLRCYSGIISIIFKKNPDASIQNALRESGFTVIELPKNPYLNLH